MDTFIKREWYRIRKLCGNENKDTNTTICDEWKDFEKFKFWCISNGFNDKSKVHRVNNEDGFKPSNCVLKDNKRYNWKNPEVANIGVKGNLEELCRHYGISVSTVKHRVRNGWELEDALRIKAGQINPKLDRDKTNRLNNGSIDYSIIGKVVSNFKVIDIRSMSDNKLVSTLKCLKCGNENLIEIENEFDIHLKKCKYCNKIIEGVSGKDDSILENKLKNIWYRINGSCYNENHYGFRNNGLKGIEVCEEWREDYKNFKDWAIDNGFKVWSTLSRRNENGNYTKENCYFKISKSGYTSNRASENYINDEKHNIEYIRNILIDLEEIKDKLILCKKDTKEIVSKSDIREKNKDINKAELMMDTLLRVSQSLIEYFEDVEI